ncbi:uncharacterized protein LOC122723300 [Manihot esculenta]|uniref:uncharacterized protein LOC122723300 n=1 Tax=Manihot esculenta TaxID=3983 RepID=UPI001CC800EC|nr:uncharacterized protein LOC122723300 [Manihot esculenta]
MPFGLKNAEATYQRLMNKVFKDQIGRNVEVYVDDMVVKSPTFQQHMIDLREVFDVLEQYRMRLNPAKYAFFIRGEKFLGYMVSGKGIEPNLEKIEAILNMPEPTCVRDVQRLTGRVVALNRFMSRSAEKCLPFFKKLRKVPNFEWTEDCRKAFEELKSYLSSPHVLSSPLEGEELLIYLAVSEQAISAVLVRVDEGEQKPVFYVSKVLKGAETRYLNIEKVAYALLLAVRKFRVYLESHQGIVMTDQPLKKILRRPETSGRMLAWSMKISPYCLEYRPRTSIKSQALADFIAECSFNEEQGKSTFKALGSGREEEPLQEFEWKSYVDGASSTGGSGAGMMLKGPGEFKVCYALRLEFKASNNLAEYEALINGMLVAMEVGVTDLEVNSDSQLVINQVTGVYQARDLTMQDYLAKVKAIEAELKGRGTIVKYQRIPREENEEADLLSRLSKEELEQLPDEVEQGQNWMTPYLEYLEKGKLPEDKDEARRITTAGSLTATPSKHLRPTWAYGTSSRLDGAKANWAEELNNILWTLRTTPRTSTKEMPFALAFGTEVVVPIELQIPTHRVQFANESTNSDKLRSNLDALEEVREEA